jgi:nitroreductase
MTPREMIDRRRSVRSYTDEPLSPALCEEVLSYLAAVPPLFEGFRLRAEAVTREEARCTLPMLWLPHDILSVYAGRDELSPVGVGFALGQLDLYLQGRGLGACWLGVGRPKTKTEEDGLSFAVMMAIGHPKDVPLREGAADFRRRTLDEIADTRDERLEPARLAPSAINGQPWYFIHGDGLIHVFCTERRSLILHNLQRMDIGIALSHLAVAHPETFTFRPLSPAPEKKGYAYIGSVTL